MCTPFLLSYFWDSVLKKIITTWNIEQPVCTKMFLMIVIQQRAGSHHIRELWSLRFLCHLLLCFGLKKVEKEIMFSFPSKQVLAEAVHKLTHIPLPPIHVFQSDIKNILPILRARESQISLYFLHRDSEYIYPSFDPKTCRCPFMFLCYSLIFGLPFN